VQRLPATKLKKIGMALGVYALGVLATVATIRSVFALPGRLADVVGIPLLWPWWLITKYGTRILPESLTAPYDPIGHPALHAIGVAANGLYVTALFYLVFFLVRWRRNSAGKSTV
jgi:hypothetical protein